MANPSRMVYQTEDTRTLILERAERLFVERGFFDAQMKDIAKAVGMSRHTLYRYYRDKADLGMAIASRILKVQQAVMGERTAALIAQPNRPALERLSELFLEDAQRLIRSADGRFLAEFDAYFTNHRAPEDFREKLSNEGLDSLAGLNELVNQGHTDGSLRHDITTKQVMAAFTGLRAVQKEVVLRGDLLLGLDSEQVNEMPIQLAELMVAGMAASRT